MNNEMDCTARDQINEALVAEVERLRVQNEILTLRVAEVHVLLARVAELEGKLTHAEASGQDAGWVISQQYAAQEVRKARAEERQRAASIVLHTPHSCMTDEHCHALHAAHKEAAAQILADAGLEDAVAQARAEEREKTLADVYFRLKGALDKGQVQRTLADTIDAIRGGK